MIFQLHQDLETNFPNETIFVNLKNKIYPDDNVPDRMVLLTESPSRTQPRTGYTTKGLQVITRDIDPVKARALAYDIFGYLDDTYSTTLSAITVDGDTYPEIFILQISANGEPQLLGEDDNGRAQFTTNYRIIFRRT